MPLYDYDCLKCGNIFEVKQSFKDDPVAFCPKCNGRSRRKFHAVPVIYKGSGFYTTDYARSTPRANEESPPSPSKKPDSPSSSPDNPSSTSENTDKPKNDTTDKNSEKPDTKKQD